jgi:hypothetical protein
VHGGDLQKIDELLGLTPAPDEALSPAELVERLTRLLLTAVRLGEQLPRANWHDSTPRSGRTALGLVDHVASHGALFAQLAKDREAEMTLEVVNSTLARPSSTDLEIARVAARANEAAAEINRWWEEGAPNLTRDVLTYVGPMTLRRILDNATYSVAQHTRQLVSLLHDYGVDPKHAPTAEDYRGISLPPGVWDD